MHSDSIKREYKSKPERSAALKTDKVFHSRIYKEFLSQREKETRGDMKRNLTKEYIQVASKYGERSSFSSVITERQIKTQ